MCPSAPSTRTDRAGATGPEWLPCPAHDHTVLASPGTENMQRAVNRALAESPSTGTELGARVSLAVWALCSFSHTWDHPDVALGAGGLHSRARSPPPAPRASPTRCFQDSPLPRTGLQSHGSSVPKPSRTPGSKGPSAVPLPSAGLIPTPLHSCLRARWLQPGGGRGFLDHRQYSHVTDDPPPHTHTCLFYNKQIIPEKIQHECGEVGRREEVGDLPGAGSAAPPGGSSGWARAGRVGRAVGEELPEPALDARLDATLEPTLGASG